MSTWSVVSTMKESLEVTLQFASYHLEIGASFIYIFLDNPLDPAKDILAAHPQIKLTLCDDDHWIKYNSGVIPTKHTNKQIINANIAYGECESEWLIHMDSDEFVYSTEGEISSMLESCDCDVFIAVSAEPVRIAEDPNTTVFQVATLEKNVDAMAEYLGVPLKNGGLFGHRAGKAFFRTSLKNIEVKIHRPLARDGRKLNVQTSQDLYVLHYLNFGASNWARKYGRSIDEGKFRRRRLRPNDMFSRNYLFFENLETVYKSGGLKAVTDMFLKGKVLSFEQVSELGKYADFIEVAFDLRAGMKRQFAFEKDKEQNAASIFNWSPITD